MFQKKLDIAEGIGHVFECFSISSKTEDISVYANSAGSIEEAFGENPAYWGNGA